MLSTPPSCVPSHEHTSSTSTRRRPASQRIRALRHDRPGVGAHLLDLAGDPTGEVEAVRAVLDDDAAARPGPVHLPVERRGRIHELGVLAVDDEAVHAAHVAVADQRAELPERGAVPEHEAELGGDPGRRSAGHEIGGFRHRARQRLLAQDREAGVEGGRGHRVVDVVGRHDR